MGLLYISNEIFEDKKLMNMVISFLRKEHKATVSAPEDFVIAKVYKVEGEDIPKGNVEFDVMAREVVPKVIAINVLPCKST